MTPDYEVNGELKSCRFTKAEMKSVATTLGIMGLLKSSGFAVGKDGVDAISDFMLQVDDKNVFNSPSESVDQVGEEKSQAELAASRQVNPVESDSEGGIVDDIVNLFDESDIELADNSTEDLSSLQGDGFQQPSGE